MKINEYCDIILSKVDCVQYSVSLQSIESVNKEFKVKEDQPDKVLYLQNSIYIDNKDD